MALADFSELRRAGGVATRALVSGRYITIKTEGSPWSSQKLLTLRGHEHWIKAVAWSPNGVHIASGSIDATARVWHAWTGECVSLLEGHSNAVTFVAWSNDGRLLATCSADATAMLWDAQAGTRCRTLRGHTGSVSAAAFSPDRRLVVTGSWDATAIVWDARSGARRHTLRRSPTSWISSVAFSGDGNYVVTSTARHAMAVWNVAGGACEHEVQGAADGALTRVAFSKPGLHILSRDWRGEVTKRDAFSSLSRLLPILAWLRAAGVELSGAPDTPDARLHGLLRRLLLQTPSDIIVQVLDHFRRPGPEAAAVGALLAAEARRWPRLGAARCAQEGCGRRKRRRAEDAAAPARRCVA